MIVKFLQYHNGREVANRPASMGDVREVEDPYGELLVLNGWAVEVQPEELPTVAVIEIPPLITRVSKRVRRSK